MTWMKEEEEEEEGVLIRDAESMKWEGDQDHSKDDSQDPELF